MTEPRSINVEIYLQDDTRSKVGIIIQSDDGEELTAQDILDAVSDVLIQNYDIHELEPVKLDS